MSTEMPVTELELTFTDGNWDTPRDLHVISPVDGDRENRFYASITHAVTSDGGGDDAVYGDVAAEEIRVEVVDGNTPGIEIIETDGGTSVSQGGEIDSYQIVLTSPPAVLDPAAIPPTSTSVRININISGQATVDLALSDRVMQDADGFYVLFDGSNWDQPVTVNLKFDASAPQPNPGDVRVFSQQPHDLNRIQGPLFIEGGVGDFPRSLTPAVALPGEFNPATDAIDAGDGAGDVDQLVVFSDTALAALAGVLTATPITGLGMPSDPLMVDYNDAAKPGLVPVPRGITYTDLARRRSPAGQPTTIPSRSKAPPNRR